MKQQHEEETRKDKEGLDCMNRHASSEGERERERGRKRDRPRAGITANVASGEYCGLPE